MTWTRLHPLTIADYLSKPLKQVANKVNARIAELLDHRARFDDLQDSMKTASLTEIHDWHSIPKERAKVLIEEVSIRQDLQGFYIQARSDYGKWQRKTADELETTKQELKSKLLAIGYTPECFNGLGNVIVPSHPRCKELRLLGQGGWDNSQSVENDEALKTVEQELMSMRSRCQI